jgi:hypothetical protein
MRPSLRVVLPAFAVAKLLTVAAMLLSLQQATGTVSWALLGQAFQHWDSISYLSIAAHGYPGHLDYLDAFLPGYPLLIRGLGVVVRNPVVAAVLVSAAAELVALAAVGELMRTERDAVTARFAVWAVALAPLGFFFTGIYTESAFIGATAVSLLLMRAGRMRGAALAGGVACAMRVTAVVLVPVMVVELLRQRRRPADFAWALAIPLPLLLYAAYMQVHIGDALAFLHAQALPSFRESAAWPWDGLRTTWATAVAPGDPVNRAIFQREVVFGILGLVAVVAGWADARFPRSFALYGTLVWLMAVSITFWRSVPRYDLALFPLVMVVADATARVRTLRPAILTASAVVLTWSAWVYARGGWIG